MYNINLTEDDLSILKIALNRSIKRSKEIIADKEYKVFIESLPTKFTMATGDEKKLLSQASISLNVIIIEGSNKLLQIIDNIELNKPSP